MRRYIIIGYLVMLAMSLGMVLTLGVFVAPVVFHSEALISETLSHFSQGLIMTEVFVRSNYFLLFVLMASMLYEGYDYKRGKRDVIMQISAVTMMLSIALFLFFYTPEILAMQQAHETDTEIFKNMHFGSELDYKIILLSTLVLLIRRFTQLIQKRI